MFRLYFQKIFLVLRLAILAIVTIIVTDANVEVAWLTYVCIRKHQINHQQGAVFLWPPWHVTEVIPTNNLYIVLLIFLFTVILFTKLDSTCSQYTGIFYSCFFFNCFFWWSFSYSFQFVTYMVTNWNMYTIHNHSTTIYIYIFNIIVHASYFEAFLIIGLRLNSILFTPSCRTKCIQPKLFFFLQNACFHYIFIDTTDWPTHDSNYSTS